MSSTTATRRTQQSSPTKSHQTIMQPLTTEDVANDIIPLSSKTNIHHESFSIDQIYHSSKQSTREHHWRNNPYAVGLVEPSWKEEINRNNTNDDDGNIDDCDTNGPNRRCCSDVAEPDMDPTCGCLVCSGYACGMINAGRIGNMVILKESHVMVEEVIQDEDADHQRLDDEESKIPLRTRKVSKRQIDLIVGPYWPMMMFVTYPLILIVSGLTAFKAVFVPPYNTILVIVWSAMTFGLCFSLFNVAFKDPGILPKYKQIPEDGIGNGKKVTTWRWLDIAQSYVPRGMSRSSLWHHNNNYFLFIYILMISHFLFNQGAIYDPDCAVVVEEFDHTCPWTGTAIGKKNMLAFQCFIGFLFSCLILDIILLTTSSVI